jgi:phosphoglycolate phosphatase
VKLVLFDVDGTLLDSRSIILAAQRAAFAAHGITPPSQERSLSVVGLSLHELFRVLVEPGGPVDSLTLAYKEAFAALRTEPTYTEPAFPGMAKSRRAPRGAARRSPRHRHR